MSEMVQTTNGHAANVDLIDRSKRLQKGLDLYAGHSNVRPARIVNACGGWPRMAKDRDADHHSAAELLGDWRAAERDTAAAKSAASMAALALRAASAAREAATETEAAVEAALAAAERAKIAAERARTAATEAAEAALLLATRAEADETRANDAVVDAESAETVARDRFHEAEGKGFSKEGT